MKIQVAEGYRHFYVNISLIKNLIIICKTIYIVYSYKSMGIIY